MYKITQEDKLKIIEVMEDLTLDRFKGVILISQITDFKLTDKFEITQSSLISCNGKQLIGLLKHLNKELDSIGNKTGITQANNIMNELDNLLIKLKKHSEKSY